MNPLSPTARTLTIAAAVGSGAVGGVLFAFSAFVMAGLRRLPPEQGLAAMQSINVTAVRPPLMIALFGTAAACVALAVLSLRSFGQRPGTLVLAACALYLVGTIALTAGYHVPHNDALALVDPSSADAADRWRAYASGWTALNHVRAGASLLASLLLVLALVADHDRPSSAGAARAMAGSSVRS